MLGGCKLDPTFISTLMERWRPETHTFHLPCGKCTITLENIALQMGLPVDGLVVMGSTIVPGKKGLCATFLGKVSNKFEGGRISMNLLETNFKELPWNSNGIVKEQYAQAFILRLIGSILILRYHRMRPSKNFGQSEYVGREGAVDSVRDGGNARIRSSVAIVWVEATNSAAIAKHG
ncbi:hypothetical protein PVK06_027656 [Gossypium arboreum]|uniref:Aminotransferase-like plant mobile domain-containing protein n=1 Tax=Gossypium arboreum TaxID=29729 RepID=A0ABR0P0V2_GOSAR|nr:hypothetical protein PVK06_027656 [Gossypium arboreum]